jgi:hypothetical protein
MLKNQEKLLELVHLSVLKPKLTNTLLEDSPIMPATGGQYKNCLASVIGFNHFSFPNTTTSFYLNE